MAAKAIGGGSSAVAASSHAACARFRGTDPLITGRTRRALAKDVGFHDEFGGIPEARWMRAMTFERLVRDKAVRQRGGHHRRRPARPRAPDEGRRSSNARVNVEPDRAAARRTPTTGRSTKARPRCSTALAIPFAGFEDDERDRRQAGLRRRRPAGPRRRGAVQELADRRRRQGLRARPLADRRRAAAQGVPPGRARRRVGGAVVAAAGRHGRAPLRRARRAAQRVPPAGGAGRAARRPPRGGADARRRAAPGGSGTTYDAEATPIDDYVGHLEATFDPAACASCTLFSFCRDELRTSTDPTDLLIEIGIPPAAPPARSSALVDGNGPAGEPPASTCAPGSAPRSNGVGQSTGQARVDQAGQPGTVNVVLAKSDSAALGVHGIATQRVTANGAGDVADRRSSTTRRAPRRAARS